MVKEKKRAGFSWLPQILCGLMLSFTVFVFAPIDMFTLNMNNFWFGYEHFVPLFLCIFGGCFALIQIVFALLRLLPKGVYLVFMALMFGLSVALYLQGNYLCMANDVLGGETPDWQRMIIPMGINCTIWFAVVAASLVFMAVKPRAFMKAVSFVSALIIAMEGVSMGASLLNAGERPGVGEAYCTEKDIFTVSGNGDVIVLMPDTLDTRIMDRVMAENSEFLKELDGFTYYRNTGGLFHKTDPTVVAMFTGEICKNQAPFYQFANEAFSGNEFFPALIDNGFTVNVYGIPNGLVGEDMTAQIDNVALRDIYVTNRAKFAAIMLRMVGYRYAPAVMQPFLFGEYEKMFTYTIGFNAGTEVGSEADDDIFYDNLKAEGVSIDNDRRFFKFYKMKGAHAPFNMNRDGEAVKDGSVTQYEQSLGCFKVIGEYLKELKENGAYDSSTIIIVADHGIKDDDCNNPMMLVKYPGARSDGAISISDAPTSLLDVRATALFGAGMDYEAFGKPVQMWEGVESRERWFYRYEWLRPTGYSFYLDKITEYEIPADATDLEAYKKTGNVYE